MNSTKCYKSKLYLVTITWLVLFMVVTNVNYADSSGADLEAHWVALPLDQYSSALDLLIDKTSSQYNKIRTWQGDCVVNLKENWWEGSFQNVFNNLFNITEEGVQTESIQYGTFKVDNDNDVLLLDIGKSDFCIVTELNSKKVHSGDSVLGRAAYTYLLTKDKLWEYPKEVFLPQPKVNVDVEKLMRDYPGEKIYMRPSSDRYRLANLHDPRSNFFYGGRRLADLLRLFKDNILPDIGKRKVGNNPPIVIYIHKDGVLTDYRLVRYSYTHPNDTASICSLELTFKQVYNYQVVQISDVDPFLRELTTFYDYKECEGEPILAKARFVQINDRGQMTSEKVLTYNTSMLNKPLTDVLTWKKLGMSDDAKVIDLIEGRVCVIKNQDTLEKFGDIELKR